MDDDDEGNDDDEDGNDDDEGENGRAAGLLVRFGGA
jgi:hypothetical protein